jgi:endonuclease YncB( thermonuclease family)
MVVARHFRRKLLSLSVSTLGFFIYSFSAVLALDFTAPAVSVLEGDTLEVLHNTHPKRIRLSGIDCPEKAKLLVSMPSTPSLPSPLGKTLRSRPTATTSTGAP